MKRKLAILLAFCLTAGTVGESAGMLQAEAAEVSGTGTEQESDYEYRETDGEIKINKYKGSGTKIVIPSEIEGKTVTGIGSFAFNECADVESIVIPSGVKKIESYAFSSCSKLSHVEIPGSVTSIEASVFGNCSSLESVEIPSSVTDLGGRVFNNCSSLKNVKLPNGITSLGSQIFYGCTSLESIQIPGNVKYIGSSAFGNCTNLKSVKLPNGITSIADHTFWNCDALTSIKIPDGVASIGSSAFSSCDNLKSVIIPASVVGIEQDAFDSYYSPTLYCAKGSYAETFAQKNGITVKDITEAPAEEPGTEQPGNPGEEEPGTEQPGDPGEEGPGTEQPGNPGEENPENPGGENPAEPIEKAEQTITAENVEKTMGNEPFLLDAETDGDGILSYESRNPEIVKVDETGTVTLLAAGTAQIVITASETDSYKAARKTITVAVIPEGYTPIHDIADLYAIRNNRSGNYILMNDIDMSSTAPGGDYDCGTGWDSIEEFRGTLDGNGYRIVGMQIFGEPAANTRVGLFESIVGSSARVKNLGMVDCNINITVKTYAYVGAICGYNESGIYNCYTSGEITVSGVITDNCYIGGLVGKGYYALFGNCYNDCEIDGSGFECTSDYKSYIGGICGEVEYNPSGTIVKCHNTGMVRGGAQSVIGAICGRFWVSSVSNSNYLRGTADKGIGNMTDGANCVSLTESQMKDQRSFTGFDFANTWEIDPYCESYPYPQLKNNRMIRVKSIELSPAPTKLTYNQGETIKITGAALKITYEDGISTTIPLKKEMLSGYDMSEIGKQEVLVNYGNAETSFEIEVKEIPVTSVTVSQAQLSIYRAKEHQLSAAIAPANATDKTVTWESDNPSVAEVSGNGLVKAKAKGTAIITASSSNGLKSKCTVTVLVPAVSIQLSQNAVTLKEGGRVTLAAQISPLDSTDAVQWKSANSGIAEVFEGNVVAKSAGTTTVTAYTESGATAACTVTVQKAATSGGNNQNPGNNNQDSGGNVQKPQQTPTPQKPKNPQKPGTTATTAAIKKVQSTKAKIKSAKNIKTRKIKLKLSGRGVCTGYKIQYGFKKNFKGAKTVTNKSGTVTLKKLKVKKTYYIRVRTYKKISGKTYYGKWSSRKSVKIKK